MRLALSYNRFLSSIFLFSLFHLNTESSSSIRPLCHNDERSALLQFKESFIANSSTCLMFPYGYPYYKLASWTLKGENSSCCSWDGVDCDKGSGHVIGLNLSNSCLYGSINSSSSLFRLVHLQVLDLSYNHFNYSHIPSTIGNLSMLTHLNLFYSFFEGNLGLCGSPLLRKCEGLSPSTSNENQGYGSSIEIDWKYVVIGYGSGFLVGIVIGHIMTTKKPDWPRNTFGTRQFRRQRQIRRGCRN